MKPAISNAIRQGTELAEFARFRAVNPITEAQLLAVDRAVAESKANGTWDAANARRALLEQVKTPDPMFPGSQS